MTTPAIGGWQKFVRVDGNVLLTDQGSWNEQNNYQHTRYADVPLTGDLQKTLHTRGTQEISWTVGGEISSEAAGILNFLDSAKRGDTFDVDMQQGASVDRISDAVMESFQVSGTPNGLLRFTMSGRSLQAVSTGTPIGVLTAQHSVPTWSCGNSAVRSFTIDHRVPLTPIYRNDQQVRPKYYRPADSEYSLTVVTAGNLIEHDTITLGVGSFTLLTGIVVSRGASLGGPEDIKSFQVQLTNVSTDTDQTSMAATGSVGGSPQAWPI